MTARRIKALYIQQQDLLCGPHMHSGLADVGRVDLSKTQKLDLSSYESVFRILKYLLSRNILMPSHVHRWWGSTTNTYQKLSNVSIRDVSPNHFESIFKKLLNGGGHSYPKNVVADFRISRKKAT